MSHLDLKMDGLVYTLDGTKKRAVLHSPFNSTRSKALGAYFHSSGFSATYINFNVLEIYIPTPSRMTVRVADVISCCGTSPTGIADFRHD